MTDLTKEKQEGELSLEYLRGLAREIITYLNI